MQNNFKYCILRFGIIYGKRFSNLSALESIAKQLQVSDFIKIGSKKTSRSFIHIDDVVQSLITSLKFKNNCSADIQGPSNKNLLQIINIISKILKKKIVIDEVNKKNPSIRNVTRSRKIDNLHWYPKINIRDGLKKFFYETK